MILQLLREASQDSLEDKEVSVVEVSLMARSLDLDQDHFMVDNLISLMTQLLLELQQHPRIILPSFRL